jgi:hypothetical protein
VMPTREKKVVIAASSSASASTPASAAQDNTQCRTFQIQHRQSQLPRTCIKPAAQPRPQHLPVQHKTTQLN